MLHPRPVVATAGARRVRVRGLAALTAILLAVPLAGCGTVPGAAVEVDGVRIAEQVVAERTDAMIAENLPGATNATVDSATRAMYNRYQVTDLVRHQLAVQAAEARGIDVADADVNAFLTANGGAAGVAGALTIPVSAAADAAYDYLVLQELVESMPADGVPATNVTVTVDAVAAADRAEAVALREKYLADPAALDADAAAARDAGTAPGGEESLFDSAHDAQVGIFSADAGEIVLFPRQGGGYFVIRVTERTETPARLTQNVIYGAQSIEGYLVLASQLLADYADDVAVNPRFGMWDPATLSVLASTRSL